MILRRDVFQAIADPVRRQIITSVAKEAMNLNSVADTFDISRQAVSNHIKILQECGLITIQKKGRERYCEARLDKLNEVVNWVDESKKLWTTRFKALDNYLSEVQTKAKKDGTK